ncbi:nucleoid-associated protein [Streptococcus merionis]|uniref:nucleoid-associated protein n=1 Tax=Streptococcus merionis TaxID=400065 RepID=UPI00351534B3
MEKLLRLFHFSRSETNDVVVESGTIFSQSDLDFDTIVADFELRIQNCVDDKNAKNFRFKRFSSQIVTNVSEIFKSKKEFDVHSEQIAEKFKDSISKRFINDFYLVVFSTKYQSRDVLFIVKMETGTAIQVDDENTLKTLESVLPDKKSRLQKAVVIYRDKTIQFKEGKETPNSERENIHSRVLDRSDENISGYFLKKFLESDNVIDDPDSAARIAIQSIKDVASPYLKAGLKQEAIVDKLHSYLSEERQTSFEDLINASKDLFDFDKPGREIDSEKISEEAYNLAKKRNNTVLKTFIAKLNRPPKEVYISRDDVQKLKISYLQSMEEQGYITWDEDGDYKILRIDTNEVPIVKKG